MEVGVRFTEVAKFFGSGGPQTILIHTFKEKKSRDNLTVQLIAAEVHWQGLSPCVATVQQILNPFKTFHPQNMKFFGALLPILTMAF